MYIAGDLWVANAALALWYSPPPGGPISPDHEFYHVALILPELSQREEIFSGSYPSFETHLAERRIHEIWTPRNWSSRLPQFKHFHTTDISQISHLIDLEDHVVEEVPEFTERFYYARKSKGGEELKAIEYASRVASYAHRGIKETISQNIHISETTLAAQFKHHSAYCYTRLQAYPPVIALDRHTAVLHHRVGEDESNGYKGFFPDQPEPSPQTLLVDAAPEYMGYASSLTRTWLPRPGADTELIDMVKRIQAAVIRRVTPPIMSWLDVYPIATEVLVDELLEHGFFLEGVTSGDVITSQAWRIFMPHEIGHHVGLDLYDYGIAPKELHVHFGTAFTIGPGIYFIPSLWNETSTAGKLVNWPRVKEWAATGVVGVRHEDVVIMWHDESVTIPTREVV
ncbi:peptidase M24, structural domain-containing protein [Phlyctochytrium arcticum]|nr:peptidase M24, structural domain-containing protein [Phlyctochytrium arcticum]